MEDRHVFWKALKVSFRVKSKLSMCISLLGLFVSLLPAYTATVLERFTNELSSIYAKGVGSLGPAARAFLLFVVLNVSMICFRGIQRYYLVIDSVRIKHYISETVIRACCNVKYKYLENYDDFHDKVNFVESQAGQRVANSMQSIIVWLQDIITFTGIVFVLGSVSVPVVALLMVATLPSVYLSYKQKDEDFKTNTKYMKEGNWVVFRFKQICNRAAQKEIRFFRIFQYLKAQWRRTADAYFAKKNCIVRKYLCFNAAADLLRNGVYIFVLLITAGKIFENPKAGLGTFMLVFALSSDFQNVTARIFNGIAQFINDRGYMQIFFSLEGLEKEERDDADTRYTDAEIEFSNVSFRYPNSPVQALHDISVKIRPGEKVAIVGENGSGKTTFINLLCAMYEPDRGSITIGREPLGQHVPKARRSISAMFQNYGRYETSIRRNISMSDPGKACTDELLHTLAKQTGAFGFISKFPRQWDELVGTVNQDGQGKDLSGGQWQKLAMTRALYRDRAEIMILDEPTSALDPISEAEIYREFTDMTKEKTVILVSHRLGITSLVDRILVFDKGAIAEEGSHDELMERDGLYARMYRAQAQWYVNRTCCEKA